MSHLASDRFLGLLLGCAVGDALGLPAEGLSPQRARRWWRGQWRHRFVCGRGMWSDDTEHTFMVGQSLLAARGDVSAFQKSFAWRLRWWLVGLPAGVGKATARAALRLWWGYSPTRSGVHSAGNGPAMRSALLGAFFADDASARREFVAASTRITHTDPKAEVAALAIAEAAAWSGSRTVDELPDELLQHLAELSELPEWTMCIQQVRSALRDESSTQEFAQALGLQHGVTGYALHTVPVALYGWLRHPYDFRAALISVLDCGGDTDTTGAIVGALAGWSLGHKAIPVEWREGLWEWPRTYSHLIELAHRLASAAGGEQPTPVRVFVMGVLLRNLLFLAVVLAHGFRRLLPPW